MVRLRQPDVAAVLAGPQRRLLAARPADPRHRVARRRLQLHRDDSQHARPRHADAAPAGVHLDDPRHAVPRHHRVPGHHRRARAADVRPLLRHALLRALGRWRSDSVAAPVLDVRPSRGLHPDPARDGHRVGSVADILQEAAVRIYRGRVFRRADRVSGVERLEPPHVLRGARADRRLRVCRHDDADRDSHRREDLQLESTGSSA